MTLLKSVAIAICVLLATLVVQSQEGDKRQPTREELTVSSLTTAAKRGLAGR